MGSLFDVFLRFNIRVRELYIYISREIRDYVWANERAHSLCTRDFLSACLLARLYVPPWKRKKALTSETFSFLKLRLYFLRGQRGCEL